MPDPSPEHVERLMEDIARMAMGHPPLTMRLGKAGEHFLSLHPDSADTTAEAIDTFIRMIGMQVQLWLCVSWHFGLPINDSIDLLTKAAHAQSEFIRRDLHRHFNIDGSAN